MSTSLPTLSESTQDLIRQMNAEEWQRHQQLSASVDANWRRAFEEARNEYQEERDRNREERQRLNNQATQWRRNANEAARIIVDLRTDLAEANTRRDQADRDNRNLRDTLQRIELLIGNKIPTQEIAFRSSCIKYTSPAYWIFSIYDMVYGFCSTLKTHLCGIKSILL